MNLKTYRVRWIRWHVEHCWFLCCISHPFLFSCCSFCQTSKQSCPSSHFSLHNTLYCNWSSDLILYSSPSPLQTSWAFTLYSPALRNIQSMYDICYNIPNLSRINFCFWFSVLKFNTQVGTKQTGACLEHEFALERYLDNSQPQQQ